MQSIIFRGSDDLEDDPMKSRVLIYTMKACPYCQVAKKLLEKKGAALDEVNLDDHPDRWEECECKSGLSTVPQIFIGDRHVGGCEELQKLDRQGTLDELLKEVL
jgi:glutaredoxin 3